jgi:UDP-N-acetylmuramate--alanine ligase
MAGLILEAGGIDPLVIVGSKVRQWNSNLRFSESEYFLVEACEHQAHMLELSPRTIVLTNISADHLDYYGDLENIIAHFQKYIDRLPDDGLLIFNYDDENLAKLKWHKSNFKIMTFSFDNADADVYVDKYQVKTGQQDFWVMFQGEKLVRVHLPVPGLFNVYNALAAITLALSLGVHKDAIKSALEGFKGTWRRFENLGEKDGILYISDYGHHPDAINGTIQAVRDFYPERRVLLVFQPHHHNRTRMLFDEFVTSIAKADVAIVSEIYKVAGRMDERDMAVSSKDLVKEIKKINEQVFYGADLDQTLSLIKDEARAGDVVLLMGAGDVVKLNKLVLE